VVSRIHGLTLVAAAAAAGLATAGCGDQRAYPIIRPSAADVPCSLDMTGYASINDSTTGGSGPQPPVTVTTAADFIAQATASADPNEILVDGMITLTEKVEIASNKTIIGVGANSGFTGAGLHLTDVRNIILRNLVFAKISVGEGDAINLKRTKYVWIDHCDFSSDADDTTSGYDGLVEITHASDWITVSWSRFHDHQDTGLIGNLQNNALEDANTLHATYHHNLFLKVNSGPRLRYSTVHLYSNHFQQVTVNGVAAETMSTAFVQQNMFDRVGTPITTDYEDDETGSVRDESNRFVDSGPNNVTATSNLTLPYLYSYDSASGTPAVVDQCAGTGKKLTP
jgi:pectate lyase